MRKLRSAAATKARNSEESELIVWWHKIIYSNYPT